MPLYEYKCQKCGDVFELIQKFSDAPLVTHAKGCGGAVERLIGAPALKFKGTGWYITDYAKDKDKGAASKIAGKNGESTASGSESTAKESKPAESSSPAKSETPAAPAKK